MMNIMKGPLTPSVCHTQTFHPAIEHTNTNIVWTKQI